ncbi:MAG TPA: hypothetical protein VMV27_02130 [Candidatus Binataceae bacterium]|nr:hypothetical protein [Candidatus Binataceae bacterium]
MNIFIVFGDSGQYETQYWPVAAFPDRGSAEKHAELALNRARQLSQKFQAAVDAVQDESDEPFPNREKFLKRNSFDRNADDFAERYFVWTIPLKGVLR